MQHSKGEETMAHAKEGRRALGLELSLQYEGGVIFE